MLGNTALIENTTPSLTVRDTECSICLQGFVHPVQLPCSHVFCFLCIKGCSLHRRRCPVCRSRFPADIMENPKLVFCVSDNPSDCAPHTEGGSSSRGRRVVVGEDPARSGPSSVVGGDHHVWFYEGHAGWWQYDERTSDEIERAFVERLSACELSIAGFLYTIDFKSLTQRRKDQSGRKRRIKRDLITCDKKGIAGLKLPAVQTVPASQITTTSSSSVDVSVARRCSPTDRRRHQRGTSCTPSTNESITPPAPVVTPPPPTTTTDQPRASRRSLRSNHPTAQAAATADVSDSTVPSPSCTTPRRTTRSLSRC